VTSARKTEDPRIQVVNECLCEAFDFTSVRRVANGSGIPRWEVKLDAYTLTLSLSGKPSAKPIPSDIRLPKCLTSVREGSALCRASILYAPVNMGILPDVFLAFSPLRKFKDQTFWFHVQSTRPDFQVFRAKLASRLATVGPERALVELYSGEMPLNQP